MRILGFSWAVFYLQVFKNFCLYSFIQLNKTFLLLVASIVQFVLDDTPLHVLCFVLSKEGDNNGRSRAEHSPQESVITTISQWRRGSESAFHGWYQSYDCRGGNFAEMSRFYRISTKESKDIALKAELPQHITSSSTIM